MDVAGRPQSHIVKFLNFLSEQKENRGVMADLRRGLSKTTEYYAWPHIAPWCRLEDHRDRIITLTIAAGFSLLKGTIKAGNMGTVMRHIAMEKQGEKGLKTFETRFRRLLTCATAEEVCAHLVSVFKAAERRQIPVNFVQLYWDLKKWGNHRYNVKVEWATEYWSVKDTTKEGTP